MPARPSVILAVLLATVAIGCGDPPRATPAAGLRNVGQAKPLASTPVPQRTAPAVPAWRVVSVHDGDTIRALDRENVETKIRLVGIDAPEIGQAFGSRSRVVLASIVKGKAVELVGTEKDRYGRTLATVMLEGKSVNLELIRQGLAWHFTRYSDDNDLAEAERDARKARRGLWADPEPVPPWEWRKGEANRK